MQPADFELIKQLSTVEGFIERYFYNLRFVQTQKAAYTLTEKEHESLFSRRRYADFESFRQVKTRKLRS